MRLGAVELMLWGCWDGAGIFCMEEDHEVRRVGVGYYALNCVPSKFMLIPNPQCDFM